MALVCPEVEYQWFIRFPGLDYLNLKRDADNINVVSLRNLRVVALFQVYGLYTMILSIYCISTLLIIKAASVLIKKNKTTIL